MSKPSSSSSKRRSFFNAALHLTPLTQSTGHEGESATDTRSSANVLKKRSTLPSITTSNLQEDTSPILQSDENASPKSRPSLLGKTAGRPGSIFGSLRSLKSLGDDDATPTTPSHSPSTGWDGPDEHAKNVLHHGEVQTSSGMFRKKKEYLVITDSHIVRFKGQIKASEVFGVIPSPLGRSQTKRHSSATSGGSAQDLQSLNSSDSAGERDAGIPLRHVAAVYRVDDGRPFFTIEIDYLDDDCITASCMSLQLSDPEERDLWLNVIRNAASNARLTDSRSIPHSVLKRAAFFVERNNDYDPDSFNLYKVVQRPVAKSGGRSTDDFSKIASTVCFLVIGLHKVHILPLHKRVSSPFDDPSQTSSYGIMNLTSVRLSEHDDIFELAFRFVQAC